MTRRVLTRRVFGFVAGVMFLADAYLAFGTYALAITREPLFLFTFLVPGLLLLVAAVGRQRSD